MKEYKFESRFRESGADHKTWNREIQELLDAYARSGWRLVSTTATRGMSDTEMFLYFERDQPKDS